MRYRLRTLLVLLALGPPSIAWGWSKYAEYRERQRLVEEAQRRIEEIDNLLRQNWSPQHIKMDIF